MTRNELEKKVNRVFIKTCGYGAGCPKCKRNTKKIMSLFDQCLDELPRAMPVRRR